MMLAATLMVAVCFAKPVDLARARAIVENNFFAPAKAVQPAEWAELYVFVHESGDGFAIVSADDCVRPVLAYSYSGRFDSRNMPPHVQSWIDGYRREIASLVAAGAVPSAAVQAMWDNPMPKTGWDPVEPLLTTTWNQRPLYNLMCPYDSEDSAYCVTGCTATATAQVMKYWNHPEVGWGSHAYNSDYGVLYAIFDTTHYRWNLMPNALTSISDSVEIMAVAELMYHVGVAVNMHYSPSGSGAYVNAYGYANYPSSETALKTYFKYSPLLYSIYKSDHSDAEWDNMIATEILAGRPVLYSGHDPSGGHAFVLDGIDSVGMFHVNWGWGGAYDGYYTTDSLSPGAGGIGGNATYTFNLNNSAVIGIQPAVVTDDTTVVVDMRFDSTMGSVSGNGTYTPFVDEVSIWAHAAEGYRFMRWAGGSTENPLYFLANGNISDSAIFAPVHGDTVGYCDDSFRSSWHDDYGDVTQWGIRLPAAVRNNARSLSAVQYIPYQQGTYTLEIYVAEDVNGATPVYTADIVPLDIELQEWTTYTLDSAIWLADTATVWITMSYTGGGYPATMGRYSGNSDGLWYHLPDGWTTYDQLDVFYTWMMRGIFEERLVRVSVETNLSTADYEIAGITIVGAGDYIYGDTACLFVNPGTSFAWGWNPDENLPSDSENPKCFVATADTTLYAWFHFCTGIDDAETDPLKVSILGRTVSVDLIAGTPLKVYDMQGRLIATTPVFTAPAAGIYMIVVDGRQAKKITVL